jgi:hypothetical protein
MVLLLKLLKQVLVETNLRLLIRSCIYIRVLAVHAHDDHARDAHAHGDHARGDHAHDARARGAHAHDARARGAHAHGAHVRDALARSVARDRARTVRVRIVVGIDFLFINKIKISKKKRKEKTKEYTVRFVVRCTILLV